MAKRKTAKEKSLSENQKKATPEETPKEQKPEIVEVEKNENQTSSVENQQEGSPGQEADQGKGATPEETDQGDQILEEIITDIEEAYLRVADHLDKIKSSRVYYPGFRKLKNTFFRLQRILKMYGYGQESQVKSESINKNLFNPAVKTQRQISRTGNSGVNTGLFNPTVKSKKRETDVENNQKQPNHHIFKPQSKIREQTITSESDTSDQTTVIADNVESTDPKSDIKAFQKQQREA